MTGQTVDASPRSVASRDARYLWLAQVFLLLFVLTVVGAVTYAVLRDRDVRLAQQLERAQGNALIFEDDTTQTLQLVENTLRALPEVVDGPLSEAPPALLNDVLRRLKYSQPAMRSLSLLDDKGRVRASSQVANLGQQLDLTDFLPADNGRTEASVLRVGPVWEGRDVGSARATTGAAPGDPMQPYLVPLLMRLGEGAQAVWLLAALNPEHLLGRMERFHRSDSDQLLVARIDGRGLITSDDVPNGQDFPFPDLLSRVLSEELGTQSGSHITAFRTSPKYPAFVTVRIDREVVLASWQRRSLTLALATLLGLAAALAGYTWLMRRVREGERAEARHQTTIVRLSQALEQSPSGILIFNDQGRIEYCNHFFRDMTGYAAQQILGRTPRVFDGGEAAESRFEQLLTVLREGGIWRGEVTRLRVDGSTFAAQVVAAPLRDVSGQITHFVSIEHDLTVQKRTLAELALARDRAEAATRAKSAFLANMSHEIRTPMNGVIGIVSLLLDSPLQPEQRDQAQTLRESAESLLHLIDDILDFSKAEAGKLVLHPVPFVPADLAQVCCQRLDVTAKAKALEVRLELLPGLAPALLGDAQRIQQVLINLIGNAIKFTTQGRVTVRLSGLSSGNAETAAGPAPTGLRVEVQDSGIGIPSEAHAQLFKPFSQVDSSTTRAFGGTGLGLSICRQLVEAMGGQIGVRSQAGEGATFWFEVPLPPAQPPAAPPQVAAPSADNGSAQRLHGNVLLVEDQPVNQKLTMAVLARLGLNAVLAHNGREALACLREQPFDLVLMDCQMPVMDGYEATTRLRAGEAGEAVRSITVLALTANVMAEDLARCQASGFDGHVAKPFTLSILRDALMRYLPVVERV